MFALTHLPARLLSVLSVRRVPLSASCYNITFGVPVHGRQCLLIRVVLCLSSPSICPLSHVGAQLSGILLARQFPVRLFTCNISLFITLFIQTNISFIENSAGLKGAAIYIASLGACLWDEHYPYYNLQKSLRWDDAKFVYRGNYLQFTSGERSRSGHEFDIATDTAHFHAPQGEESLVKVCVIVWEVREMTGDRGWETHIYRLCIDKAPIFRHQQENPFIIFL